MADSPGAGTREVSWCGWVCWVLPNAAMAESREGSGGVGWAPGIALQTLGRVEPCSARLTVLGKC